MSTIDSATSGISILAYSSNIISQNDTDSDDALTLDELEVDEETFNSIDTDNDGYATKNEIAEAINNKLAEYDEMPSLEEFSSLLSDLGLDVSIPTTSTSTSASQILSTYDSDGDYSLSSEESSLSDDEFSALDSDSDGYISTEELVDSLETLYGTSDSSDTTEVTSEEDEEETTEETEDSSEDEEEDLSLTSSDIRTYTLQMLLEALDMADDDEDNVAMSNLEKFMELYNEEDESGISTYLENMLDSSSSTSTYA